MVKACKFTTKCKSDSRQSYSSKTAKIQNNHSNIITQCIRCNCSNIYSLILITLFFLNYYIFTVHCIMLYGRARYYAVIIVNLFAYWSVLGLYQPGENPEFFFQIWQKSSFGQNSARAGFEKCAQVKPIQYFILSRWLMSHQWHFELRPWPWP